MNTVLLDELVALVNKQNLRVLNVVVRQNGELMARHDFEEEQPHLLYSASKTFTSMAVGIAVHEGNFKLDDLVVDFFPDYFHTCSNNTEFLKRITIHHLLCMGSGHAECPVNKADWRSGQKWDIAELFLRSRLSLSLGLISPMIIQPPICSPESLAALLEQTWTTICMRKYSTRLIFPSRSGTDVRWDSRKGSRGYT